MEYGRAGGGIEALAMAKLIYITEDDDNIRELLRCTLESYGYRVQCFDGAAGMFDAIRGELPDLILLDIMMPGMDGMEALRILKNDQRTVPVPVIMLTAKSGEVDKVTGLDLGADDYITKPFSPKELVARIKAVMRRISPMAVEEVIEMQGLSLDPSSHRVMTGDSPLDMGPTEFKLLHFFMTHPERVYSREQLLNHVWGTNVYVEDRTVDVHIRRLRKALEHSGHDRMVQTVRGTGYRFSARF